MAERVLVVEDSAAMRAFVVSHLEGIATDLDLEIVEAASGFEALRLLPHGPWTLILTDINMPDINGLELVSFLKSNETYRTIPVVVFSTERTDADRERARALGAEAYIVKPFTDQQLLDAVRPYLGRR